MKLSVEHRDELEDFLVLADALYEELTSLQIKLWTSNFALEHCDPVEKPGLGVINSEIHHRLRIIGRLYEQAKNFAGQVDGLRKMRGLEPLKK